jgi:large subunit ribosomal protein L31
MISFIKLLSIFQGAVMKEGIHPKYFDVVATCVCGNSVQLGSTKNAIRVEICSNCHPFYTGQQKIVDTEGRVDRFVKRYKLDKDKAAAT